MGFIYLPHGLNQTSIALETRKGTRIKNYQSHEFTPFEQNQYTGVEKKYQASVNFRTVASPIYNCHGLTFASRRTGIYDNPQLELIIGDDGYTEIPRDRVLPGDIILYYSETGDIEHSGIVVSEPDKDLKVPRVVSKWGKYREAIHWAHMCPYDSANLRYFRVTKWD